MKPPRKRIKRIPPSIKSPVKRIKCIFSSKKPPRKRIDTSVNDKTKAYTHVPFDGPIGLVLSGGGAKGAFQAGVWKAMHELGLAKRVRVISGTSVGALNAAAFATINDPETICEFWRTHVEDIATTNWLRRCLSRDSFCKVAKNYLERKPFPFPGVFDRDVLEQLIRGLLPTHWPEDAPEVIATSLRSGRLGEELDSSSYQKRRFHISEEPDFERRVSMLLASAAFPGAFDSVELNGKSYVDGGWNKMGGENTPKTPILNGYPDIKTVIVVRCNSAKGNSTPFAMRSDSGRTIVEVRPTKTLPGIFTGIIDDSRLPRKLRRKLRSLSGTFAFKRKCATRSIRQGYSDGLTALRRLWISRSSESGKATVMCPHCQGFVIANKGNRTYSCGICDADFEVGVFEGAFTPQYDNDSSGWAVAEWLVKSFYVTAAPSSKKLRSILEGSHEQDEVVAPSVLCKTLRALGLKYRVPDSESKRTIFRSRNKFANAIFEKDGRIAVCFRYVERGLGRHWVGIERVGGETRIMDPIQADGYWPLARWHRGIKIERIVAVYGFTD